MAQFDPGKIEKSSTIPICLNYNQYKDKLLPADVYFYITRDWKETILDFESDLEDNKYLLYAENLDLLRDKWNDLAWVKETRIMRDNRDVHTFTNVNFNVYPTADISNVSEAEQGGDPSFEAEWLPAGVAEQNKLLVGIISYTTDHVKFPYRTLSAFGAYEGFITELVYHALDVYYKDQFRPLLHMFDIQSVAPYREIKIVSNGFEEPVLLIGMYEG